METLCRREAVALLNALGNFLSGMETYGPPYRLAAIRPLETSLVEWKLGCGRRPVCVFFTLGTFLSGMETSTMALSNSSFVQPWKLP